MKASVGSFHLFRKRRPSGGFYPCWQVYLRFPGRAESAVNTGYAICPRCLVAEKPEVECKCRKQAARVSVETLARWNDERWEGVAVVPHLRRQCATVAELLACYREHWNRRLTDRTSALRNATSLELVLAYALDLWTVKREGVGPRGVRVGDRYPDAGRVGELLLSRLNGDLARAYFENRLRGAGLPVTWAADSGRAEHVTINSTFAQAGCLFTPSLLEHVFRGRVVVPDVSAFVKFTPLVETAPDPAPIKNGEFAAMVEASEALRAVNPDLWLCATLLRQTGIRSGSAVEVRAEWLERLRAGWILNLGKVKGGTAKYSVPVSDGLAVAIQEASARHVSGLCFGETLAECKLLVNKTHNQWLKSVVRDVERGSQGNHRLRDTLSGALKDWLGADRASKALGHANGAVTSKHYARLAMDCTEVMRAEFAAWGR